jgi:Protein involved in formate dehydrogenase formation
VTRSAKIKHASDDPIVQRLRTLAQESPNLKDAAMVYEAILPILRDADLGVAPLSLTPEEARVKMKAGLPLLHGLDLELDLNAVRALMLKLVRAVETVKQKSQPHRLLPWLQSSGTSGTAATRIRLALEEDRLDISALLSHTTAGESHQVSSMAQGLQLDTDLLRTLAQNTIKPALRTWYGQTIPLSSGIPWNKGNCFVCGAAATLGELQENDQVRHLRCGSCGADWKYPRMQCMYCGNEDHRTQRYLYEEERSERMRVEACDNCRGYVKVISAFSPTPPEMLLIEDLATIHLDYAAESRGYSRTPRGKSENFRATITGPALP